MTNEPSAPQTEGQRPTVERGGLWGLMFSLAALLFPPYGVVLSVFGIVQGWRARRTARTAGVQAPGAVLSVVVGVLGVLWALLMGTTMVVFSDELSALTDCNARANTVSAGDRCQEEYLDSVNEHFDQPLLNDWAEITTTG
ncbi:DUF4190 domain-containing protein [Actinorugispora endophytica]|uniref:DUF4190 domain-containing protein n=1 Tax=Actinorugispora endophytica TaxID=1605990 RepID=A0A4R6UJ03_9ACTN|nr:DUF4190 domain-containing protein [Actinorugispora endophytica]TDQ45015.1 hypothetical protein EV190_1337 [Actinorugispora endophytica]